MPIRIRCWHGVVPRPHGSHGSAPDGLGTLSRLGLNETVHLCASSMMPCPFERIRQRPFRLLAMLIAAVVLRP